VKRKKLIKILTTGGCELKREGSKHSIWHNPKTSKMEAVPRHTEVAEMLAKKIIKNLTK